MHTVSELEALICAFKWRYALRQFYYTPDRCDLKCPQRRTLMFYSINSYLIFWVDMGMLIKRYCGFKNGYCLQKGRLCGPPHEKGLICAHKCGVVWVMVWWVDHSEVRFLGWLNNYALSIKCHHDHNNSPIHAIVTIKLGFQGPESNLDLFANQYLFQKVFMIWWNPHWLPLYQKISIYSKRNIPKNCTSQIYKQ